MSGKSTGERIKQVLSLASLNFLGEFVRIGVLRNKIVI